MDSAELVSQILSCPDCGSALTGNLRCTSCSRSLAPEEDGIMPGDLLPSPWTRWNPHFHKPLKPGETSRWATLLKDIYAITDPARIARSLFRRLGLKPRTPLYSGTESAECDLTPYEKPFLSHEQLTAMLPGNMLPLVLRSQGILSFRELPPYLQNSVGKPLAFLIVRLDE